MLVKAECWPSYVKDCMAIKLNNEEVSLRVEGVDKQNYLINHR